LAAKSLGFAPSNCIVFEDSFSGIKAAKSAGMYCIAYQPTNNMIQDSSQADKLIRSFHEINVNRMKEYIKAQNYNPKTL
jgi:beta-phosphoglucomutase-like phosphatase (HAD superfamily)